MTYKIYLLLTIGAITGSVLGWLIGDEKEARKLAAKGVAALMIATIIIPAFMKLFELPIEIWMAITGISSVIGVEIIILLTKKLKEYINNKIKTT